ncbi:tandem-95 repeat protein [Shimia sp. R10_1]|uniref:Ig-like domain-containing protein n=1 Tax=Shimia sp. R10_1 TaxID=2821095 RepID=UPI001ADCA5AC|nr:Ig-like domain-containing protein [Shimia sp. R10_1]MBO9475520.1 tandem-95 repeat protein [Shimia sp. R10_1]
MSLNVFGSQQGSPDDFVIFADGSDILAPNLDAVFQGHYSQDGQDLILTFEGDAPLRIAGYFSFAEPADLIAPNGAILKGADVARLAGAGVDTRMAALKTEVDLGAAELTQTDLIQSQAQTTAEAIGQVDTIAGVVTVTRADGSTVRLNEGGLVFQDDVVQTGARSTVSLLFVDGTVFTLAPDSRMILDELIYDPGGSDGTAAFNLIQGGFVFVAGQVARVGEMEVNTPTSTIGIRGTTVEIRIVVVNGVSEVIVSLLPDWPDGNLGRVDLFDQNGAFVSTLTDPETSWIVSPIAGETRPVPRADVVQADTDALVTQTNDATERAELRLENLGTYIDFNGAGTGEGAPDGGGQTAPGDDAPPPAPAPQDGGEGDDGQSVQPPQGQDPDSQDPGDTEGGEDAPPPPGDGDAEGEDDASLQPDAQQDFAETTDTEPGDGDAENIAALALAQLDAGEGEAGLEGVTNVVTGDDGSGEGALGAADPGLGPGSAPPAESGFGSDPGLGATGGFDGPDAGAGGDGAPAAPIGGPSDGASDGSQGGGPDSARIGGVITPAAADLEADVLEDTSLVIALQDAVTDASGTPLTFAMEGAPAHGTVTVGVEGALTYTPDPDFAGTDSFTYSVENVLGGTDTGIVTLTVEGVNDAPVAGDDSGEVAPFNVAIEIPMATLLANDTDGDPELNQPLEIVAVGDAEGGTVAMGDGMVRFTPEADYAGPARFRYDVSDGAGGVTSATVTLTVAANTPPVAPAQTFTVAEDASRSLTVLGAARDADGHTLTLAGIGQPTNGAVAISADGAVTYTPAADFNGSDSFTYTIADGNGGFATGLVLVTVTPVNDAPVAGDDTGSTDEDTAVLIDVLGNDTDVEGGALFVSAITDPAHGTVTIDGAGLLRYTPDADFNGSDAFTYTVSDGDGGVDMGTVLVTVAPVNDAPVAQDDLVTTSEDVAVTFEVTGNDSDADGDDIAVSDVSAASNGTVELTTEGDLRYTPEPGFFGSDSFSYTITDGTGASATATVRVTVALVNLAPEAGNDSYGLTEDGSLTVTAGDGVLANDSDPDGDALSVSLQSDVSHGVLSLGADGSFTYTPDADFNGVDGFAYTVSDGFGGSDVSEVVLTIAAVNDAPVAAADGGFFTPRNTALILNAETLLTNDTDGDPELVQALSVVSVEGAVGGTVALVGGTITFIPETDFEGAAQFSYDIVDAAGGAATGTVTLSVGGNRLPVAGGYGAVSTNEDSSVYIPFFANDSDPDGDTLTLAALGTPAHGSVGFDGEGYLYTPDADFNGVDAFSYTIDDGNGGQATGVVTVTVLPVNDAPTANDDAGFATGFGADLVLEAAQLLANDVDPEGDTLSLTSVGNAVGGTVALVGTTVTFTPSAGQTGAAQFDYAISDGNGGVGTGTVFLTIGANQPPVAAADSFTTTESEDITGNIFADNGAGGDFDPEGGGLTLVSATDNAGGDIRIDGIQVTLPSGASLRLAADGSFEFDPGGAADARSDFEQLGLGDTLEESFSYVIADPSGAQATGQVTIEVTGENDAPVPTLDEYTVSEDSSIGGNALTDTTTGSADADPDGDSFTLTAINGSALADADEDSATAGTQVTVGDGGQLTIFADGSFTFDTAGAYDALGDGVGQLVSRLQSVLYTVTDANGASASETLRFVIQGVNDAPTANNDTNSTDAGIPVVIDVISNDSDAEGDALSVQSVGAASNGTTEITGTGAVTYTPDAAFSGVDSFTYTLRDAQGDTATATVTVSVAQPNRDPVAEADSYSVVEDGALSVPAATGALANDSDPDGDSLQARLLSDVSHGTLTFNPDGSFAYAPDLNFNGSDNFTYEVEDGNGGTASATININITAAIDPVVLQNVTGDDFIDVSEQLSPITVAGNAEPDGEVTVDFGGTIATADVAPDGQFSVDFLPEDLPDAPSFQVSVSSVDAFGNASGSTSKVVSIEQLAGTLNLTVAGSATTEADPPQSFDLMFGDMPEAALFEVNEGVTSARAPNINTATEIRFTAEDGRSFAFTGTGLDYDAGIGVLTGLQVGTAGDADFILGSGFAFTVAGLKEAISNSIVGGNFVDGPLEAFFGAFPWTYNGSDEDDWISVNETTESDDIFHGNGGDDRADFGLGDDQYFGGAGNDIFSDTDGNNSFDGGPEGVDQVTYAEAEGAVDVDLNAGRAEKSDGTLDTLSQIEGVEGSLFADSIQLQDGNLGNRVRGLQGNDTLTGGVGGFDQVAYDQDSRYTINTVGVTVNLAIGIAFDLFGDTDVLAGFESVLATEFNDILTAADTGSSLFAGDGNDTALSGDGNDLFELGAGQDTLVYTQGFDFVQDFNVDEDTLVFSGFALANFDSLVAAEFDDGTTLGTILTFEGDGGIGYTLVLAGVTTDEIAALLEMPEFYGSPSDDIIELVTVSGAEHLIYASEGNDTYIFTNNTDGAYQAILYNVAALELPPITANLNVDAATNTIDKGDAGTDTLVDLANVVRSGFGVTGTQGDDTYNVTLSASEDGFIGIFGEGGDDTVNLFGGQGWVRINAGVNGADVTADLGAGTVSSTEGSFVINRLGDTSDVTLNLRTFAGNDTVIGSEGRDAIILGPGIDSADARGGTDTIQYNRYDIDAGVTVNLATGIATGTWAGRAFTHTLSNFERVRGSDFADHLTASESGSRLRGFGGDNTLIGGSGQDTLWGWEGDEVFDSSRGSTETQGFGDLIEPWSGRDTIIGHQAHWESGEGIEIGYWNLTGTGGLQVTLGLEGSGTVVSNVAGVVNDTFTYANFLRATDENDRIVGADSYGVPNESFNLRGGDGNDTIIGGGGRENMRGEDGDDLLDASGGSIENQFWGDFVRPGAGMDRVIGHQALWEGGDGIDISYEDVDGTDGVVITVGALGSGTVVSNAAGVVNDTFTYTHYFGGTHGNDLFTGSDHVSEGWIPFAGRDTINGGAGEDKLSYLWDGEDGGSMGVTINAQTGTAIDPFGDTDVFTSIERFRGTDFDDTIIGSTNDEEFELEGGADQLTYVGGYDFVDDFVVGEDTLQFSGDPLTYIGTLNIVSRSNGPGHSFRFDTDFDDSFDTAFELTLKDVSIEGMYQILSGTSFTPVNIVGSFGRADYFGTPGDDSIAIGGNDGDREKIHASAGEDTYDFSASTNTTFTDLAYDKLGPVGITAELDFNQSTNTVDKGVAGTDTLINAASTASAEGLFLIDGDGDDTYNITQHASDSTWIGVAHSLGHDTINFTGTGDGGGTFRVSLGSSDDDVTGDLAAGSFTEGNDESVTVNLSGDLSTTRIDIQTRNGDDFVFGNDLNNRFILGSGDDFADAREGWDVIRYNRSGVETGVTVSLAAGTATGVWDGEAFAHTLVNFEEIHGSWYGDTLIANDLDNRLEGRGGDDVLIGGAGNDTLESRDAGQSVLIGNGGDDEYRLGGDSNLIVYSGGNDFVSGFDPNVDMLQWDSALVGMSFTKIEYVFDGDTRVRFAFDDGVGGTFGIDFESTTSADADVIISNMTNQANYIIGTTGTDDIEGTTGNDDINPLGNTGEADDEISGSEGDDTIRFTQASEDSWYFISYADPLFSNITLDLDLQNNSGTVDKGVAGFDTLVDPLNVDGGIGFAGTDGDDTYNIAFNATERSWLSLDAAGGSDVVNLTGGDGRLRLNFYDGDVSADLSQIHLGTPGTMSSSNGSQYTINADGDFTYTVIELRSVGGNDTLIGSEFGDRFILGAGTDSADGRGDIDRVRYNRGDVDSGVTVDLQAGVATGTWDGSAFVHTLQNIEIVDGSAFDDQLTALDAGYSELQGHAGDDVLNRSDFEEDLTDGGDGRDTLVQTSSGSFDFTGFNVRGHYRDIEVLSFENGGSDTVTLSLAAVMDLSETADALLESAFGADAENSITVLGDPGDRLTLEDTGFSQTGSMSDGEGRTLDVYQFDGGAGILAIVAVDQDVSVEGGAAST